MFGSIGGSVIGGGPTVASIGDAGAGIALDQSSSLAGGNVLSDTGVSSYMGSVGGGIAGGIGGFISGLLSSRDEAKMRNRVAQAIAAGESSSYALMDAALSSPEYQAVMDYYMGAMEGPYSQYGRLSSGVYSDYRSGLRQAQADRGMYFSGASASDEARRLAGLSAMVQSQAAPGLQSMIGFGERYRQQIAPFLMETESRLATGGARGWMGDQYMIGEPMNPVSAGIAGIFSGMGGGF